MAMTKWWVRSMVEFTPHEAPAREAAALPVQHPGRVLGRDAILQTIYTHLTANKPVFLYGVPGVGKTALAATLASAYTNRPGGVLWLHVDDSPLEELVVRVGRAYRVAEIAGSNNPLAMVGAAANTLMQNKPFVVLDGALNPAVAAEFVTRCLGSLPAMFIGETNPGASPHWAAVELEPLALEDATLVLQQQASLSDDPSEMAALAQKLERLPLALVIGARTMLASKQTPAQFLDILNKLPAQDPVTLTLGVSFRGLNSALQGLVLMMGAMFNGMASAELLSMMSGAPVETIQQVMNMLGGLHIVSRVQRYNQPYYMMHSSVYQFAQSWLRSSNRLDGLQEKLRDTLIEYARKYSSADSTAHDKLAAEMDAFLALAAWSAAQGQHDVANRLVFAITQAGDFSHARGYVYELLRLNRYAASRTTAFPAYTSDLPQPVAELLEDEDDEDLAYEETGGDEDLYDDLEEEETDNEAALPEITRRAGIRAELQIEAAEELDEGEAELEVALETSDDLDESDEDAAQADAAAPPPEFSSDESTRFRAQFTQARQIGDRGKQAETLRELGQQQVDKGLLNDALLTYTEALSAYEALGDDEGLLDVLDSLSALMLKTDNAQAAVLHASRGIKLAEDQGSTETQMDLLVTLGDARQELGESTAAVRAYSNALELARAADDAQHEALILHKLSFAQLDDGDADTAINTWEQALALFKKQGKRNYEGRVLGGLGTAYGELERWSEAINFHTSALYIAREVDDSEEEYLQLTNLAYACSKANQLGQAVLRYRQALHLAYDSENRENIVSTIVDLARLLAQSRKHLEISRLLLEDAAHWEPHDRDVLRLKERIANERNLADASGIEQARVTGSSRDYAANAYKLLDE